MIFRFTHRLEGAHVHVRVFGAPGPDQAFAKFGDLTMQLGEWLDFRSFLVSGGGDVKPDGGIDLEWVDD
jgi:hypothetical protein